MRRRLLLAVLAAPLASGCLAMQSDVRTLQAEVADLQVEMQADQDRLLREIRLQNEAIIDSLRVQDIRMRGDFANQLVQIERQLVTIQELTGQGQQRLAELRESIRATEEALRRAQEAAALAAAGGATSTEAPEEVFAAAEAMIERGSLSTARLGFQEFVSSFPQHELVPLAKLHIGEILEEEDALDDAIAEYTQLIEAHPDAPEAPAALLRIALIERQRGNDSRARSLLNEITSDYARSPQAEEARAELRRMR